MAIPLTTEQAVDIALCVLHHEPRATCLRAGPIVELALDSKLRSFWVQKGITLPWHVPGGAPGFAAQLAKKLKNHVEKTPLSKHVIDGKATTGWKLGQAAGRRLIAFAPSLDVSCTEQHLGLAGEYAVMSELLALNWSVAKPPFDDGVDLFATQKDKVRTVQVKTAKLTSLGDGVMAFIGGMNSVKHYHSISHYYVLVFRLIAGTRWQNSYYICNSNQFDQMLNAMGTFDPVNQKWSLKVHRKNGRFLIAGATDITDELDRFESRFM